MKSDPRPHFPKACIEDSAFWQRHIELQSKSGLNKMDYCRQNKVDYARFKYWIKTKNEDSSKKSLIAVKLKPVANKALIQPAMLCKRSRNHRLVILQKVGAWFQESMSNRLFVHQQSMSFCRVSSYILQTAFSYALSFAQ